MFEIWDETGKEYGLTLSELQLRLCTYRGEVMVRYLNRLGLPATLFLTVQQGRAYQRFKAGTPPLDWDWLAQSIHAVPVHDADIHLKDHALRRAAN